MHINVQCTVYVFIVKITSLETLCFGVVSIV